MLTLIQLSWYYASAHYEIIDDYILKVAWVYKMKSKIKSKSRLDEDLYKLVEAAIASYKLKNWKAVVRSELSLRSCISK